MKSSSKFISFTVENTDGSDLTGFKIVSNSNAKQYMKALKLLIENGSSFDTPAGSMEYSQEYFTCISVAANDIKVLEKLFNIDCDDTESNTVGFFPDIMEDAYTEGILDDDSSEDYDDAADTDEDEF